MLYSKIITTLFVYLLSDLLRSFRMAREGMPETPKKSKDLLTKRGRMYAKAIFTGYQRSQRNQNPNVALLKIEGATNQEDAEIYIGKRCYYMYKSKNGSYNKHNEKNRIRMIWGKVMRVHGNTGSVRAKFTSNLPAYAMSRRIRINSLLDETFN
ncbi:50S ribosomal protein L35Ae [Armadillidium vulgare]|nr:50S ribosomal protein L35Ae [Armadillidium vulgare]